MLHQQQRFKVYRQALLVLIIVALASSFNHGNTVSSSASRINLKRNKSLKQQQQQPRPLTFLTFRPRKGVKNYSINPQLAPIDSVDNNSKEKEKNDDLNSVSKSSNFLNINNKVTKRGLEGLKLLTGSAILFKIVTNTTLKKTINRFFLLNPFIAAFTVCAIKASSADFIVQKTEQNDKQFEYKRNLAFLLYGGAYQGCVQEYIFNHMYPLMFGSGTDIVTVSVKVFVDMLIISPFLCLPVAYMIKGAIYKNSIMHSIKRYIYDIKENNLLKNYWMSEFKLIECIHE